MSVGFCPPPIIYSVSLDTPFFTTPIRVKVCPHAACLMSAQCLDGEVVAQSPHGSQKRGCHAAASLHSALAPGEEAFQGMQKAEEGRFGSRDGGIQGRGGRRSPSCDGGSTTI